MRWQLYQIPHHYWLVAGNTERWEVHYCSKFSENLFHGKRFGIFLVQFEEARHEISSVRYNVFTFFQTSKRKLSKILVGMWDGAYLNSRSKWSAYFPPWPNFHRSHKRIMKFRDHSNPRPIRQISFNTLHQIIKILAFIQESKSFRIRNFPNNIKLQSTLSSNLREVGRIQHNIATNVLNQKPVLNPKILQVAS